MAKLETTSEIRKYFELENNENTTYQDMRLNESYVREKCIILSALRK